MRVGRPPGRERLCSWHRHGKPTYAQGKRYFAENCDECAKRLAAGLASRRDPTPKQIHDRFRQSVSFMRKTNPAGKRENMLRAREMARKLREQA